MLEKPLPPYRYNGKDQSLGDHCDRRQISLLEKVSSASTQRRKSWDLWCRFIAHRSWFQLPNSFHHSLRVLPCPSLCPPASPAIAGEENEASSTRVKADALLCFPDSPEKSPASELCCRTPHVVTYPNRYSQFIGELLSLSSEKMPRSWQRRKGEEEGGLQWRTRSKTHLGGAC